MRQSLWDVQGQAILIVEPNANPAPERWAIGAQIHGDVVQSTARSADELRFAVRSNLVVQTANRTRTGVVRYALLIEPIRETLGTKRLRVERSSKKTARVVVHFGFDDKYAGKRGRRKLQNISSSGIATTNRAPHSRANAF